MRRGDPTQPETTVERGEQVTVTITAEVGPNRYILGEQQVTSVEDANAKLPALLRAIADEYEQA